MISSYRIQPDKNKEKIVWSELLNKPVLRILFVVLIGLVVVFVPYGVGTLTNFLFHENTINIERWVTGAAVLISTGLLLGVIFGLSIVIGNEIYNIFVIDYFKKKEKTLK